MRLWWKGSHPTTETSQTEFNNTPDTRKIVSGNAVGIIGNRVSGYGLAHCEGLLVGREATEQCAGKLWEIWRMRYTRACLVGREISEATMGAGKTGVTAVGDEGG